MTPVLLVALLLVAVGAWLQGNVGFGMNLLSAPLLIVIDERFVPGPLLVAAIVMTAAVVVRERRAVHIGSVGWAFAGRIPGAVAGAAAVATLSRDALAIVLAAVVLAAVAASASGLSVPVRRETLIGAGMVAGFTGTTTAVGGPPMALLLQHQEGDELRGNLAGFFLLGASLSIGLLAVSGSFGLVELRLGALLAAPVVVGFAASSLTAHRVSGPRVRPAVLAVAGVSAVGLLVRTLLG